MALDAEKKVETFFREAVAARPRPEVTMLFRELADEEVDHQGLVREFQVSCGVEDEHLVQCCSFTDPDSEFGVGPCRGQGAARSEGECRHLAFDAARHGAATTGDDAFLKDLVEHRVMKRRAVLRGE